MGEFGRFKFGVLAAAALGVLALTNGCSAASNLQNGLCCKSFAPGTNMLNASFTGDATANAKFAVFAQAIGDLDTVAEGAVADVQAACTAIATDLGDDPQNPGAMGKGGTDLMNFWCSEAVAKINASFGGSASGKLTVSFDPPQCSASVSVQGDCQAHCNVNGSCNVMANPPTCMGGTLEVSCMGSCMGSASAAIDCTGSCSANCTGTCQATGGVAVNCTGKCDGTCAAGGAAMGSGVQADGSCKGTCSGTCHVDATAPKVMCQGQCSGKCEGMCSAMAGASVQCSGMCSGMATPLSCKGGTLQGGCMVDANCQANCNASASAKADCTPPAVTITASGMATGQIDAAIKTLEVNLPTLLVVVKARGTTFAQLLGTLQASGTGAFSAGLDAQGTACLIPMAAALTAAATDFPVALSASVSVVGSVGVM